MKKNFRFVSLLASCILACSSSRAFTNGAYSLGLGYYSQNFFNVIAKKDNGDKSFTGETTYLLNFKYDYSITHDWFVAPQLSYSPVPRSAPGSTAEITLLHFAVLFGSNFTTFPDWDWYFGPGFMQETIKGKGGIATLSNGTGTANFAIPGDSATIKKFTLNIGTSYRWGPSRFSSDIVVENGFSSKKRTQSLMLGYSYIFGGGLF